MPEEAGPRAHLLFFPLFYFNELLARDDLSLSLLNKEMSTFLKITGVKENMSESVMATELPNVPWTKTKRTAARRHS